GWSRQRRSNFLTDLLKVILGHEIIPLAVAVDVRAFDSFTEGERRALTGGLWHEGRWAIPGTPNQPYFLGFDMFVTYTTVHALDGIRQLAGSTLISCDVTMMEEALDSLPERARADIKAWSPKRRRSHLSVA